MNFITIDFETATSDRDSACEIGLTFVENWEIKETKSWLIKPNSYPYFNGFNISIHGITPNDVANTPEFDEIWKEIEPLITNKFLIAHNASFDFSVLRKTLDAYNLSYPTLDYSCSYIFSKKVWEGLPSYDLKTLCQINNIKFKHHRAGDDSRATAELAIIAFKKADVNSIDEFPDKLRTIVGKLYNGGYDPSETKRVYKSNSKAISTIIGNPAKINKESIFHERTVMFTGTLSSMIRAEAQQIIADIGGVNATAINKETDYLVIGQQDYRVVGEDGMSKKQEKAVELIKKGAGIEIISETDFIRNI